MPLFIDKCIIFIYFLQVTYQLRILCTAFFSWLMLDRRLTPRHWLSLVCLMVGVWVVQVGISYICKHMEHPLPNAFSVSIIFQTVDDLGLFSITTNRIELRLFLFLFWVVQVGEKCMHYFSDCR